MREYAIHIDLRNPGQFFACCGILYCADRMFKHAEGYFKDEKFLITADCDGSPIDEILKKIKGDTVRMTKQDSEKADSPLDLCMIPMRFDFYNHIDNRPKIKLFAGQEKFKDILSRWLDHVKKYDGENTSSLHGFNEIDIPSGLDADTSWNALDVGFSLNEQRMERRTYPLVEFFAHVGIQAYAWSKNRQVYKYRTWPISLPITIARAVASGAIRLPGARCFEFRAKKSGQKQVLNTSYEVSEAS
ncbi:MAG: hypothetical protein OXI27_02610 [Thaumarchaeota archaeon]|nr:hypothetical protein [Nitrososphaerota archaeon]